MITTHCNKSYVKLAVSLSISLYCRYFQTVVDLGVTETMETTARDKGDDCTLAFCPRQRPGLPGLSVVCQVGQTDTGK